VAFLYLDEPRAGRSLSDGGISFGGIRKPLKHGVMHKA